MLERFSRCSFYKEIKDGRLAAILEFRTVQNSKSHILTQIHSKTLKLIAELVLEIVSRSCNHNFYMCLLCVCLAAILGPMENPFHVHSLSIRC